MHCARLADSAPARWSYFWTYTPPARANALRWHIAFLASPVSFRPAASTWDDLHRQTLSDQQQLAAGLGRSGTGGGHKFFGLYCIRGLRPLVETVACILAVAGWVTGMVHPALALLVLVTSAGAGIVTSMAAVVLRELAEPSGMAPAHDCRPVPVRDPGKPGLPADPQSLDDRGILRFSAPKKLNRGRTAQDRAPAKEIVKKQ